MNFCKLQYFMPLETVDLNPDNIGIYDFDSFWFKLFKIGLFNLIENIQNGWKNVSCEKASQKQIA